MNIQFSEGLPFLEIDHEKHSLCLNQSLNRETQLISFYDHFLADDMDHFAISKTFAPGLYGLVELLEGETKEKDCFVKGQSVGPVTFASGILGPNGKAILHSRELLDACTQGLAIKALWQAKKLAASGRKPVLFLDEPSLSGFGSAFSSLDREEVIRVLRLVIDYLKERMDLLIGIHCCGNTDWGMLLEAGPDIINFDAFSFLDYFLLYPREITAFLKRGGGIAWGVVPTSECTGTETIESLLTILKKGLHTLISWNITAETIGKCSILTPSCGMGTMTTDSAQTALSLLAGLSDSCARAPFSFT